MNDTERMRQRLRDEFPKSKTWQTKVDKMSDNQVLAIYRSLQQRGRIR